MNRQNCQSALAGTVLFLLSGSSWADETVTLSAAQIWTYHTDRR